MFPNSPRVHFFIFVIFARTHTHTRVTEAMYLSPRDRLQSRLWAQQERDKMAGVCALYVRIERLFLFKKVTSCRIRYMV